MTQPFDGREGQKIEHVPVPSLKIERLEPVEEQHIDVDRSEERRVGKEGR